MTLHFELSIMIGTLAMVGLGRDQVEEPGHGRLAVDHSLVHVDVDDVGAVFDLLAGHGQRRLRNLRSGSAGRTSCEPVTLVRSPIMMKLVSGRMTSGSMPL